MPHGYDFKSKIRHRRRNMDTILSLFRPFVSHAHAADSLVLQGGPPAGQPAAAPSPDKLLLEQCAERVRLKKERGEPLSEDAKFLLAGWASSEKAAAPVRPKSKVEILKENVARIEKELAACPACGDMANRWQLVDQLNEAQARLDALEGLSESELKELMAKSTNPKEQYAAARALNSL